MSSLYNYDDVIGGFTFPQDDGYGNSNAPAGG